jgi:rRNA-processing protein FCF1
MVKVIFDSNFLFVPFQFQIDIFEELGKLLGKAEPIILTTTFEELETLARKRSPKMSIQASAALELAKKCKAVEAKMKLRESYDDVIVRTAVDSDYLVATNDSNLRKRLRESGVAVVFLRQKSHLEIEGRFLH